MKKGRMVFLLKGILLISLVCSLIFLLSSAAFSQKKRISIGGASAGGSFYVISVAMADTINRFLPEYNAIALETGGALENIRLIAKGEIETGVANMRDATLAYKGEKPFMTPLKNLRLGLYVGTYILHVVVLERSKIKTIEDLKGKIVNIGAPGSIVASTTEAILRLNNISMKDIKVRHMGISESMEAMGDGLIDAACIYSAIPASAITSLAVKQNVRLVSVDEKILKNAGTKENILCYYVPPNTYRGQNEGAFAWAVVTTTYYNEVTSAEDVYKWTKAILEHKDMLVKVHPSGKEVRLVTKEELEISPIPTHPGVIKYGKEVGISY